jgi:hypothetical protein
MRRRHKSTSPALSPGGIRDISNIPEVKILRITCYVECKLITGGKSIIHRYVSRLLRYSWKKVRRATLFCPEHETGQCKQV